MTISLQSNAISGRASEVLLTDKMQVMSVGWRSNLRASEVDVCYCFLWITSVKLEGILTAEFLNVLKVRN